MTVKFINIILLFSVAGVEPAEFPGGAPKDAVHTQLGADSCARTHGGAAVVPTGADRGVTP